MTLQDFNDVGKYFDYLAEEMKSLDYKILYYPNELALEVTIDEKSGLNLEFMSYFNFHDTPIICVDIYTRRLLHFCLADNFDKTPLLYDINGIKMLISELLEKEVINRNLLIELVHETNDKYIQKYRGLIAGSNFGF